MEDRCPYCGVKLIIRLGRKLCPNCGVIEEQQGSEEECPSYVR